MCFRLRIIIAICLLASVGVQPVFAQGIGTSSRRQRQKPAAKPVSVLKRTPTQAQQDGSGVHALKKVPSPAAKNPVAKTPAVKTPTAAAPVAKSPVTKSLAPKPQLPELKPTGTVAGAPSAPRRLQVPADVRPVPAISNARENAMPAQSSGPQVNAEKIDEQKAEGFLPPLVGPESILQSEDFDSTIDDGKVIPPTEPSGKLPLANYPNDTAIENQPDADSPEAPSFPPMPVAVDAGDTADTTEAGDDQQAAENSDAGEASKESASAGASDVPSDMAAVPDDTNVTETKPVTQSIVRPLPEPADSTSTEYTEYEADMVRESIVPIISLETVGPREFVKNETVRFKLIARNLGELSAEDIKVNITLPAEVSLVESSVSVQELTTGKLAFEIKQLEPNAQREFTIDLKSTELGVFDIDSRVAFAAVGKIAIGVVQPQLAIECEGPSTLKYGEQREYKVRVTNTGDGTATNILITSKLPEGFVTEMGEEFSLDIGALGEGEMREITLPLMAETVGKSKLDFSVQADHELIATTGQSVNVLRPAVTAEVKGPDLIYLDREAVYAVTVSNPSKLSVTAVRLKLVIPDGLHVTSIDQPADFDKKENSLTWSVPEVGAGLSHTVQLKATATQEGRQIQNIQVTAAENVSSEVAHDTMVISRADVSVVISDNSKPIKVGESADFTVTLKNSGTKAARTVRVEIELSDGLRAKDSTQYAVEGMTVVYEAFNMDADQIVNLNFTAVGIAAGDHVVRASMKHDESDRELSAEESVFYYDPVQKRVASRSDATESDNK